MEQACTRIRKLKELHAIQPSSILYYVEMVGVIMLNDNLENYVDPGRAGGPFKALHGGTCSTR